MAPVQILNALGSSPRVTNGGWRIPWQTPSSPPPWRGR